MVELYKPFKSKAKNKKYSVYVKGKGGQFKDKLGEYKHLDHGDPKRRKAYYDRHGKATSKDTAKFWSHKILW